MAMALEIKEKQSCWEFLQNTDLPIFIYGMGDGALKILSVFEKYNIPTAGFFASDEFVLVPCSSVESRYIVKLLSVFAELSEIFRVWFKGVDMLVLAI